MGCYLPAFSGYRELNTVVAFHGLAAPVYPARGARLLCVAGYAGAWHEVARLLDELLAEARARGCPDEAVAYTELDGLPLPLPAGADTPPAVRGLPVAFTMEPYEYADTARNP